MTIYFIRAVDCGRIKIGYTDKQTPAGRVRDMSVGCPSELEIVAYCDGSQAQEKSLHAVLHREHVRGEWFAPGPRLASLLAYVEEFKTTDGWQEAEESPKLWAQHVIKHGNPVDYYKLEALTDNELRWKRVLARVSRKPSRRVRKNDCPWQFRESEWSDATENIVHEVHPYENYETESLWFDGRRDGSPNAGQARTALLLADSRSLEETAALWVGACLHSLPERGGRGGDAFDDARIPDGPELRKILERRIRNSWWHHKCTMALPIHFPLPKRCTVTADELLELVRNHRRMVIARYGIRIRWAQRFALNVPKRAEAA